MNIAKIFLAAFLLAVFSCPPLQAQTVPAAGNDAPAARAERSITPPDNHENQGAPDGASHRAKSRADNASRSLPFGVTVMAVAPFVFVLALVLGIVGIAAASQNRRSKLTNETLRALIDKGQPLTPELVDGLKQLHSRNVRSGLSRRQFVDLRAGLVLVAVGGGVWWMGVRAGVVILLVGVALLVCAAIAAWWQAKSNNKSAAASAVADDDDATSTADAASDASAATANDNTSGPSTES